MKNKEEKNQANQGGGKEGWIEMELKSRTGSKKSKTEEVDGG
jgi:hypothetical protein